ncbi:hypothetical protein C8Q74DRAFT_1286951 [Fomes fomentarius]|nr:hypothetical protein C8Q74DRAFT_1286951 [Fomes fomentarius]
MRPGYQMRARIPAAHTSAIARAASNLAILAITYSLVWWTLSARNPQSATSWLVFFVLVRLVPVYSGVLAMGTRAKSRR